MNSSGGITMRVVPSRQEPGRAILSAGVPEKGLPPCQGCHGNDARGQVTFPRPASTPTTSSSSPSCSSDPTSGRKAAS